MPKVGLHGTVQVMTVELRRRARFFDRSTAWRVHGVVGVRRSIRVRHARKVPVRLGRHGRGVPVRREGLRVELVLMRVLVGVDGTGSGSRRLRVMSARR
jgi:hypothetical protein